MPYPIEIVTTNRDLLKYLIPAYLPLNKIQDEFHFSIAPKRLLDFASLFNKDRYTVDDVLDWLDQYRKYAGGHRPFIIVVIDKTLSGNEYDFLFGGHEAKAGYAVFTTEIFGSQVEQFLFDIVKFCRYYIVRYTLSFINPEVKSHTETRGCMFDFKEFKRDIMKSLKTGDICPECFTKLSSRYNLEIANAVPLMLKVVSDRIPLSLVMKGGGVKGLAFTGALLILNDYEYKFDTYAGTSAGAIAAILLAAGYTAQELLAILKTKDFNDFKDATFFTGIANVFRKNGFYEGKHFKEWINDLIRSKSTKQELQIKMEDLQHRAIVYASRSDEGILRFDSKRDHKDAIASFAVRCSMSIPGFFTPVEYEGYKVYDGGIGNNFPLRTFIDDNPQNLFLGLYLHNKVTSQASVLKDMGDLVTDGNERELVDKYSDRIVHIDTYPIKTTQFDLTDEEKTFLIDCGKVGALQYLFHHRKDLEIDAAVVDSASRALETKRTELINPFEVDE